MQVFEITTKVYLFEDIKIEESLEKITEFINHSFSKDQEMIEFHEKNQYKFYTHDNFYPLSKTKIYEKEKIYQFRIRTVDPKLCEYFLKHLENTKSKEIKGITSAVREIPKKLTEKIYTITPLVIKTDDGYHKNNLNFTEFESRIMINLKKKYMDFTGKDIPDFEIHNMIKYDNDKPVAVKYKEIKMLGDKITLALKEDDFSQDLAYFALGTGLGEMNSVGLGYVNYKWY